MGDPTAVPEVETAEQKRLAARMEIVDVCPGCFADSRGGSWGEGVSGQWCMNCGSHGTVQMPVWAVDSFRANASWVGKRYYPHQEDISVSRELRYLRSLAPPAPDRMVTQGLYEGCNEGGNENAWTVRQKYPDGSTVTTTVKADSIGPAVLLGQLVLAYPVPESFGKPRSGDE